MSPAPSTFAARAAVQALAAAGVREVVLSPGSRSAPLVYALADAARPDRPAGAPALEVHVRIDERDAAFLALGIAKAAAASGAPRPVAVVTTSGTAVAHLLPAVLEAHHSGTALVLVTADRPRRLRGTGANQTTFQPGLLEPAVRLTLDIEADSVRESVTIAARTALAAPDPGPVHVNLAFDEPLVPGTEPWPADPGPLPAELGFFGHARTQSEALGALGEELGAHGEDLGTHGEELGDSGWDTASVPAGAVPGVGAGPGAGGDAAASDPPFPSDLPFASDPPLAPLPSGPATVVVAGDGAGAAARELAESRGWPLLAEPASGARGGPNAVPAYRLLLDAWRPAREVRRVVVLGRPTLSRPVARLLAREDVEVVRVQRPAAAWPRAGGAADVVVPAVPSSWFDRVPGSRPDSPSEWLERWLTAGQAALARVHELSATRTEDAPLSGPALADLVARASRPDDVLVIGSSNPVRDLDLVAGWDRAPLVIANRGLSGIDGMTATAAGVALALPDRTVRAVVGDLTFLHDVGGLLVGPLELRPRVQIIVANDDGGSVFATLEHGDPERADVFERFFATPHGADLAALCAGYGVPHQISRDPAAIAAALAAPRPGISVLEVPVDRTGRRELDESFARDLD